jgi:hypothetical protein
MTERQVASRVFCLLCNCNFTCSKPPGVLRKRKFSFPVFDFRSINVIPQTRRRMRTYERKIECHTDVLQTPQSEIPRVIVYRYRRSQLVRGVGACAKQFRGRNRHLIKFPTVRTQRRSQHPYGHSRLAQAECFYYPDTNKATGVFTACDLPGNSGRSRVIFISACGCNGGPGIAYAAVPV